MSHAGMCPKCGGTGQFKNTFGIGVCLDCIGTGWIPERKENMPEKEKQEWTLTKEEVKEFEAIFRLKSGDNCAMESLSMAMGYHRGLETSLWGRIVQAHKIPYNLAEKLLFVPKSGKIVVKP